jgi:hypothetical protein
MKFDYLVFKISILIILLLNCNQISTSNEINDNKIIQIETQKVYSVNVGSIYLHEGPDTSYDVIRKLHYNDSVIVNKFLENSWCEVVFYNEIGWVYSDFLTPDSIHQPSDYYGWQSTSFNDGILKNCNNCSIGVKNDEIINNSIIIQTGLNTEILFYLINNMFDECYYGVYLRRNSHFELKNIPEGNYYYKVIYGSEPIIKSENGICKIKFLSNPIYEKSTELLDLNIKDKHVESSLGVWRNYGFIPSISLMFDINSDGVSTDTKQIAISEEQFFEKN